jgi:hypothetical protein
MSIVVRPPGRIESGNSVSAVSTAPRRPGWVNLLNQPL